MKYFRSLQILENIIKILCIQLKIIEHYKQNWNSVSFSPSQSTYYQESGLYYCSKRPHSDLCMYSLAINTIIFKYLNFDINGLMTVPILSQLTFCSLHYQNVIFFSVWIKPQFIYPLSCWWAVGFFPEFLVIKNSTAVSRCSCICAFYSCAWIAQCSVLNVFRTGAAGVICTFSLHLALWDDYANFHLKKQCMSSCCSVCLSTLTYVRRFEFLSIWWVWNEFNLNLHNNFRGEPFYKSRTYCIPSFRQISAWPPFANFDSLKVSSYLSSIISLCCWFYYYWRQNYSILNCYSKIKEIVKFS